MKLLTRDTDYALRAVCFIARQDAERVAVPLMVEALKIPHAFLRKILQVLSRKKILRSYKGTGGGFALRKKSAQIRIAEVIEIFQGPLTTNECFLGKSICPDMSRCVLRKHIISIESRVVKELNTITVNDLLRKE